VTIHRHKQSLELSVPLTTEYLFNIGSISKTFTALAMLQLEAQGKLIVQDALSQYVPEFPDSETITLHHLLSNTSGVSDYLIVEGSKGWYALPHTPTELLELIRHQPCLFAPGKGFGYSNSNWVLLVKRVKLSPTVRVATV
jgi:CubicO group peptidase (beta-lactamase class C family)